MMHTIISPTVLLEDLTLVYTKDKPLFENFSCTFPGGKWTSILGRSGIGKSTLLRVIAGLEPFHRGKVFTHDKQPLSHRIAYMAQKDLLMPWLTVLDNVLIGTKLRGENKKFALEKAKSYLDRVNLSQSFHLYPHQISGGMAQRVALARTLMEEKCVVLMDEPFAALDALTREELQELAMTVLREKTVIFITHDPREALKVSHIIYVMVGNPAKLLGPLIPHENHSEIVTHEMQIREWLHRKEEMVEW